MTDKNFKIEDLLFEDWPSDSALGVKITHKPTGKFSVCTHYDSMHRNRQRALTELNKMVGGDNAFNELDYIFDITDYSVNSEDSNTISSTNFYESEFEPVITIFFDGKPYIYAPKEDITNYENALLTNMFLNIIMTEPVNLDSVFKYVERNNLTRHFKAM